MPEWAFPRRVDRLLDLPDCCTPRTGSSARAIETAPRGLWSMRYLTDPKPGIDCVSCGVDLRITNFLPPSSPAR